MLWLAPLKKRRNVGRVPILLAPGDGGACDAYAALARMLVADPTPPGGAATTPLFRDAAGRPLSHWDLTVRVRHVARAALDPDAQRFSGRSLRIGGATDLAALGVQPHVIQLLGRWSSEAHTAYTRVSQGQALRISAALGGIPDYADPTLEAIFPGFSQPHY